MKHKELYATLEELRTGQITTDVAMEQILLLFSEKTEVCVHPRYKREYIGSNMLVCKICGKEFS